MNVTLYVVMACPWLNHRPWYPASQGRLARRAYARLTKQVQEVERASIRSGAQEAPRHGANQQQNPQGMPLLPAEHLRVLSIRSNTPILLHGNDNPAGSASNGDEHKPSSRSTPESQAFTAPPERKSSLLSNGATPPRLFSCGELGALMFKAPAGTPLTPAGKSTGPFIWPDP